MQKKFIVKTPFGIGVATSEEDLKGLLSFVEGITAEEEGEDSCDCLRCQAEAAYHGQGLPDEIHQMMDGIAEKLVNEDGDILSFDQYVNRFMGELASELKASKGEPVSGDERSESQPAPSVKDILSMIFGEQKPQQGEAPEDEQNINLETVAHMNDLEELTALQEKLSQRSLDIAHRKGVLEDEQNELNMLLDAVAARKTVVKAGNAGEARAKVREQFTALESVLNDASMKTSVSDEVFKEVARLKEKFSL